MPEEHRNGPEEPGRVERSLEQLNEKRDDPKQPAAQTTNSASETAKLFAADRDMKVVEPGDGI